MGWERETALWAVGVQLATCNPRLKGPAHLQLPQGVGSPSVG